MLLVYTDNYWIEKNDGCSTDNFSEQKKKKDSINFKPLYNSDYL